MARVIWAPKALADLEALLEYIARDAPVTATPIRSKAARPRGIVGRFSRLWQLRPGR